MSVKINKSNYQVEKSYDEKIFYLLNMEIMFLNRCLLKTDISYERILIKRALIKLERLQKINLRSADLLTKEDYDRLLNFIIQTIEIVIVGIERTNITNLYY